MSRHGRRRHHHRRDEDLLENYGRSAATNRHHDQDDDDDDIEISIDLRDIKEQIQNEVDYIEENKDRPGRSDGDAFYANKTSGSRVSGWAGRHKKGETLNLDLAKINTEVGIYESGVSAGTMSVGVTKERDQVGIEAGLKLSLSRHGWDQQKSKEECWEWATTSALGETLEDL